MSEQAERIIRKLGGAGRLGKLVGKYPSTVYRWMKPRSEGGTGGVIPAAAVPAVLAAAKAAGVELTSQDWTP